MLERLFSNQAYQDLKAALDLAATRQVAIAQNIANADTPGYRRKIVTFDDELFAAVNRRGAVGQTGLAAQTQTTAIGAPNIAALGFDSPSAGRIRIVDDPTVVADESCSTVDIFQEMSDQAENQLRFETLSELVSWQLSSLRRVIQEAGGVR